MKVLWRKKASQNLEAIYEYILKESPQNAHMVFNKIYDLANSLIVFPEKYPVEPILNNPQVRFAVVWSFKIIYTTQNDSVYIMRVFNTKQNPKKIIR
ncbi:Plasmid stabilization system protein [compost metagenome]